MVSFNFRIEQHWKDKALEVFHTVTLAGRWMVEGYLSIRKEEMRAVENLFTDMEIAKIASVIKDAQRDPKFMANVKLLHQKLYSELGSRETNLVLLEKVKELSPAQSYFLQEEIYRRQELSRSK